MKSFILSIILLISGFALSGCSLKQKNENQEFKNFSENVVFKPETAAMPEWIKNDPNRDSGPWNSDLYIATSTDGLSFVNEKLFASHAGVANIIQTQNGDLIATFQYFSFKNEEMFDMIAYSISKDSGVTWSPIMKLNITELSNTGARGPNAVDPTLVQLSDGKFRLYFTYELPSDGAPQLYSAVSESIDGEFKSEGKQLSTGSMILDPAVVFFNNKWHHYTVYHGEKVGEMYKNVHSTSATGTEFQLENDITLDMSLLGDVITVNDGLRFYGSGDGGVRSAYSTDGYNWMMDSGTRIDGADPGVVQLDNGHYVMIYTGIGR